MCWCFSRTSRYLEDNYCRQTQHSADFLCEFDSLPEGSQDEGRRGLRNKLSHIHISLPLNLTLAVQSVVCPRGHLTHTFLACDVESACNSRHTCDGGNGELGVREASGITYKVSVASFPAMFECTSGQQRVPYSLMCDHRRQCADGSDESFCVFAACPAFTSVKCATTDQCIPTSAVCDNQGDCDLHTDEALCAFIATAMAVPPPAVVLFTHPRSTTYFARTLYYMHPFVSACPQTHFQCPGNGYCLPVFLRCNGVSDCPGREDEAECGDRVSCPGFYRCRSSGVCLHPSHLCDDWYQCPEQDDERFCGLTCPAGCACHGLAFACRDPLLEELRPDVRYLDASGSGVALQRIRGNRMLVHLGLSRCGVRSFCNMTFPNLRSLDLSRNDLRAVSVDHLRGLMNLRYLSLSKNPLELLFMDGAENISIPALSKLDVSGVRLRKMNTRSFSHFTGLETLNLSHCGVLSVTGEGLHTHSLRFLDISGCPMITFPRNLLSGLAELQTVKSDNFKICCPASLPAGFIPNCAAPFNEVSSCESLLRSDVYVVFLSAFSSFALLGNLGCFLTRTLCSNRKKTASGFEVFVTHLSISDFLMGAYLAIIGVADRLYKGSYLWEDLSWRRSASCKTAGFLSLLSNEVSAFIICLITLDRFLVLRFPFSRLHFQARSAHVTCAVLWVLVLLVVAVPLTPMTSHWFFFGQTGICIPLPVSRVDFAGRGYAFGVMIVVNFILFLFIAAGQAAIYASVRANRLDASIDSSKKSKDLRVARRLLSVAVSDFLCWFPIGLIGLLAFRGVPVPSEVNVGLAILVLPVNSALNPFLYTINVLMERRRRSRDENLFKRMTALVREVET